MPIRPPALDDRSFDDLVEEALARIPAHTPEWTNPRAGDPGRTLIELFAWLTDTLLYRANLIPERQRLAFLRLLGVPMRPAIPARGLISLAIADAKETRAVHIQPLATLKAPASFETRTELTVLPLTAEAYYKRPLTEDEQRNLAAVVEGLQQIYALGNTTTPYVTTPIFAGGAAEPAGFDVITQTVDTCLWLALLAPDKDAVEAVRTTLRSGSDGGQQLINIGVMPALAVPTLIEAIGPRARVPHTWEITTLSADGEPEFLTLDLIADTTGGLTKAGVLRFALPGSQPIQAPTNDVRLKLHAGVGDWPPRIDAPKTNERLVGWIRLRPTIQLQRLSLSWVGINAVEIDGRQTMTGRVLGQSSGAADQEFQLPGLSVEPETLELQVEERGRGYQTWQRIDDLALAGRDSAVYSLDAEAGVVRFGNGLRGRVPEAQARVRVATMRAGGGATGNLPPGSLSEISARELQTGTPLATTLKVQQSLATEGGVDAETLEQAEQRIPGLFKHGDRAITEDDYKRLAAETPAVRLGRVEVLAKFKPHQRRFGVPGVVSVMVFPFKAAVGPPYPRPDRPLIETVHGYLDARRPLSTELYVIGCEYIPLGISTGITIRAGFGRESVVNAVREALRRFLWSLPPGGADGTGWPLGQAVGDRELEVVIARVPGVEAVAGVTLFEQHNDAWQRLARPDNCGPLRLQLQRWQLPELLAVVVSADGTVPDNLRSAPNPFANQSGIAVPVVPEVC